MDNLNDYIECARWSSTHYESEECDGVPFDEVDAELAEETREIMAQELADFELAAQDWENENILERYLEAGGNHEQLAHDFWLTRNGHGTGFWDRELGSVGQIMTEIAKSFGSSDLYLGDDGLIYVS